LATLIVREKGQPDRSFALVGDECVIGRGDDTHLRLPNVSVSRFHTRLIWGEDGWEFEDLQSQNGTIVNGKRQDRGPVRTGDEIFLGKYSLVFLGDDSHGIWKGRTIESLTPYVSATLGNDDNTYELSPEMLRQMQAAARRIKGARIEDIGTGRRWEPSDETLIFGGRGVIPVKGLASFMSAARLRWNGKSHVVQKLGWMSLTVNGKKVKESALEDGDRLKIGASEFEYMLS
jgi:pSer/pThr/pTyr-binding forkhead associated (FHA) protein